MQSSFRILLPLILTFLLFSILPFLLLKPLADNHIDGNVILGANALFFMISLIAFFIQKRGLHNKNPHVFVRSVMAGMMIKMLFCIAAVIIYVYSSGTGFNKRAVIFSLFLYLVYLIAEVLVVTKLNKQHNA